MINRLIVAALVVTACLGSKMKWDWDVLFTWICSRQPTLLWKCFFISRQLITEKGQKEFINRTRAAMIINRLVVKFEIHCQLFWIWINVNFIWFLYFSMTIKWISLWLWTKQGVWRRHLGLWETRSINIFLHILTFHGPHN